VEQLFFVALPKAAKARVIATEVCIDVVIKPEFSKFPKKIKVWSLSSSRCKFSLSVDFVSQKKRRQKVFMSFIEESTARLTDHEVHLRDAMKLLSVEKDRSF
jgi:hypothetical protein